MGDISKNFSYQEFECKCGRCGGWGAPALIAKTTSNLQQLVLTILQPLRDKINESISVTSGFRCVEHNKAVGGVVGSLHLTGAAADIVTRSHTPIMLAKMAETIDAVGGIGIYPSWVHLDTGPKNRRW